MSTVIITVYIAISALMAVWLGLMPTENPKPVLGRVATKIIRGFLMFFFWPLFFTVLIWQMRKGEPNEKS